MRSNTRPWLLLVCAAALVLCACQNQNRRNPDSTSGARLGDPNSISLVRDNPDAQIQGDRFQRVNALIGQWDLAQSEARGTFADQLAVKIQQEVDGAYQTFVEAARGRRGVTTQYLAVSALGFSSVRGATDVLVERLPDRDPRLVSNAMVALNERKDPATPLAPVAQYIDPRAPLLPKRYAPLLFATTVQARRAAGQQFPGDGQQTVLTRLASIANDPDGFTRLHVTKALGVIGSPAAVELLLARMSDDQMRVRWSAAAALERSGDPRGFTEVVRLLNDVALASKHIIRDVLASYAERLQGRALSDQEVRQFGTNPAEWSRWFNRYQRDRGIRSSGP